MNYKAVLFDLDGTLLDTLDDLADSMNAVLERHGFATHPVESYKTFVGDGVVMLVRRSLPEGEHSKENIQGYVADMRKEYSQRWADKTKPYDGVHEMLKGLLERNVKLGVLSNKPHDFTKLCVERFLSAYSFDIVQGVSDEIAPKPDPVGANHVCQSLGISAEQFLYLGDTNTDMKTANGAGMYAVGVTWGFRSAEELRQNGAKTLIDHPSELLKLL